MSNKIEILIKPKIHIYRFIYRTKFSKPAKFHNIPLQTFGNNYESPMMLQLGWAYIVCTHFFLILATSVDSLLSSSTLTEYKPLQVY